MTFLLDKGVILWVLVAHIKHRLLAFVETSLHTSH